MERLYGAQMPLTIRQWKMLRFTKANGLKTARATELPAIAQRMVISLERAIAACPV